jgi:hypothetical protein
VYEKSWLDEHKRPDKIVLVGLDAGNVMFDARASRLLKKICAMLL